MNVILLKYCEEGGRGGEMPLQQPEYYFDANWFICCCFFRFFLSLFDGSMSFSYPFKGAILTWMEYRITLPVSVCLHLFVKHSLLYDRVCAIREKC